MKQLKFLIMALMFLIPLSSFSEEVKKGLDFENLVDLNVLLCTDVDDQAMQKSFAVIEKKDGSFGVFSTLFDIRELLQIETGFLINIPEEVTMLQLNKGYTKVSGLLNGEKFDARCQDITSKVAFFSEYVSGGALTQVGDLERKLRVADSKLTELVKKNELIADLEDRLNGLRKNRDKILSDKLELESEMADYKSKIASEMNDYKFKADLKLKYNGLYETYFKNFNGKIKVRAYYKNGRKNGVLKQFTKEGFLLYYHTYNAGKLDGLYCDLLKYHKNKGHWPSDINVRVYKNGVMSFSADVIKQKEKGRITCDAEYKKPTYLNYRKVKVLEYDEE